MAYNQFEFLAPDRILWAKRFLHSFPPTFLVHSFLSFVSSVHIWISYFLTSIWSSECCWMRKIWEGQRCRQEKPTGRQLVLGSQFDEGLWQQWPSPSTEICFWHITAQLLLYYILRITALHITYYSILQQQLVWNCVSNLMDSP